MWTSTLRLLTAALALMGTATAIELPRKTDDLRPHPALRARHRPAHELTGGCRVEPVVTTPAAAAASSCSETPRATSEVLPR